MQVLGWLSCLRSPTDRHAVVRSHRIVSRGSRVRTMPWLGSHHAACAVWHVHWWRGATSGSSFHLGWKLFGHLAWWVGHLVWWPIYLKRVAMSCLLPSKELECLDRYRHILLRCFWAPTCLHRYCLGDSFNALLVFSGLQCVERLWKSGIFYKLLKRLWKPGFFRVLCTR